MSPSLITVVYNNAIISALDIDVPKCPDPARLIMYSVLIFAIYANCTGSVAYLEIILYGI